MSDDVNCAVLSPVTPSIWAQQGASQHSTFKISKSLAKILLVCKHQQPGDKDDTNQSKYFTVYDDEGTLGFLVTDNRTTYNRSC